MNADKKKAPKQPRWTITIWYAFFIFAVVMNIVLQKPWNSIVYYATMLLGVAYLIILTRIWPKKVKEISMNRVWIGLVLTVLFLLITGYDAYRVIPPYKYYIMGLGGIASLEIFVYAGFG